MQYSVDVKEECTDRIMQFGAGFDCNNKMRKVYYRAFISMIYGFLAARNRVWSPSCVRDGVRDIFLSNQYMGHFDE